MSTWSLLSLIQQFMANCTDQIFWNRFSEGVFLSTEGLLVDCLCNLAGTADSDDNFRTAQIRFHIKSTFRIDAVLYSFPFLPNKQQAKYRKLGTTSLHGKMLSRKFADVYFCLFTIFMTRYQQTTNIIIHHR